MVALRGSLDIFVCLIDLLRRGFFSDSMVVKDGTYQAYIHMINHDTYFFQFSFHHIIRGAFLLRCN